MSKWRNILLRPEFEKNWDRSAPSFANINLLGVCNADCYFCLGKDIDPILSKQNQLVVHYSKWKNFEQFLTLCEENSVNKLYITGQNTDSLMYRHLDELVPYLQGRGFDVGLRTNGYLSGKKLDVMNSCRSSVGLSIHTLDGETNAKIMGRSDIPDWENIIPLITNVRVSIVVNRHNYNEVPSLLAYISRFPNVKYIQLRRICTDTREEYFMPDIEAFERVAEIIHDQAPMIGDFYGAPLYEIHGKEICVWRTVKTDIDSYNYFTDGTISDEYFVVEGYMRESVNYPKVDTIPIDAHGMGREGFWRKQK